MNRKGQGALEYLLLIGGAVLVAAIVIALITGTTGGQLDPRSMAKCAPNTTCSECLGETEATCVVVLDDAGGTLFGDDAGEDCDAEGAVPGTAAGDFKYCTTTDTV